MVRSTGCLIFGSADRRIVESSGHYDGQTAGSSNHRFMTLRSSNCSIVGSSDCRIIGLSNREAVCRIVTPTVGLSDHPMVRSSESRIVGSSDRRTVRSSDHHDRQTVGSSDRLSNRSSDCPIQSPIARLSDHRLMASDGIWSHPGQPVASQMISSGI